MNDANLTCMGTADEATYPGPLSMRLCFAWRSIPGLCIVFTTQKLDISAQWLQHSSIFKEKVFDLVMVSTRETKKDIDTSLGSSVLPNELYWDFSIQSQDFGS